MLVEDLVARLEKVRKSGERSWSARCPSHADKGPSLRVTDKDGAILIHCFAGCAPNEVVQAIGLKLSDLFPPRNPREAAQYAREKFAKATIKDLRHEVSVALIILRDLSQRKVLSDADAARAVKAKDSINKFLSSIPQD